MDNWSTFQYHSRSLRAMGGRRGVGPAMRVVQAGRAVQAGNLLDYV